MKIVADENMPLTEALFGPLGEVRRVDGRTLSRAGLLEADVLLVRSVTPVNQHLLEGTPVRFVGSATIGTDHVDTAWLQQQGIAFSAAPGCNADSVVQYVLAVLMLHLRRQARKDLSGFRAGIVGAGNVGGRLASQLTALGLEVLVSDPPLEATGATVAGRYASLDEVLTCDLISLHTPLTGDGPHPTFHLLGTPQLDRLAAHQLLINTGRGPVIDNAALEQRLRGEAPPVVVLDVWEHEPLVPRSLADLCQLGTPHIAGYSAEGKARGTVMIHEALCHFTGKSCPTDLADLLPPPAVREIRLERNALSPWELLADALLATYDPRRDDAAFRQILDLPEDDRRRAFDRLRKDYPLRREPGAFRIGLPDDIAAGYTDTARMLRAAGFTGIGT